MLNNLSLRLFNVFFSIHSLQDVHTNFPPMFQRFCIGQAKEIARKCIEPPLRKKKSTEPFLPKPSLFHVVSFLGRLVKEIPGEKCQLCKAKCLPSNPQVSRFVYFKIHFQPSFLIIPYFCFQEAETNESSDKHVERVYCGHLFHQQCLITYMKTPPFQGFIFYFF